MYYFQSLLFAVLIADGGLAFAKLFTKYDTESKVSYHLKFLLMAFLYGAAGGIVVAQETDTFLKIQLLFLITILLSEGFVDLQESSVYVMQTICLWGLQIIMVIIRLISGSLQVTDFVTEGHSFINALFYMFAIGPFNSLQAVLIFMTVIALLGAIKVLAKGDVLIFAAIAFCYLSMGSGADFRFAVCVFAAYAVYVPCYVVQIIYRKIRYKESILTQRCPFTAPIAVGALFGLLV